MIIALLIFLFSGNSPFVVDAEGSIEYTVSVSRQQLKEYVDDIGLFARNMPGVTGIEPLGNNTFLYRTRKNIPLTNPMEADFVIRKIVLGDSLTHYVSTDVQAENWMSCKVLIRGGDSDQTHISISLRIRLSRENPSEVHWLAPVVGADFIGERMEADLDSMLKEFVGKSNKELYSKFSNNLSTGR